MIGIPRSLARKSRAMLVGGGFALLCGSAAFAIVSSNFTYSKTKTGFLSLHPAILAPTGTASTVEYGTNLSNGALSGNGCFMTGVTLPQGARMIDLKVSFQSGDQNDLHLVLHRHDLNQVDLVEMVAQTILNDADKHASAIIPIDQAASIVDNSKFLYAFAACMDGLDGTYFYGARIKYKYTTAGD